MGHMEQINYWGSSHSVVSVSVLTSIFPDQLPLFPHLTYASVSSLDHHPIQNFQKHFSCAFPKEFHPLMLMETLAVRKLGFLYMLCEG